MRRISCLWKYTTQGIVHSRSYIINGDISTITGASNTFKYNLVQQDKKTNNTVNRQRKLTSL